MRPNPAFVDRMNGQRVQVVPPLPAPALDNHQIGGFQYLQMLHHRAAVDIPEMVAKRSGGKRLVAQIIQYLPPHWRSEGFENNIVFFRN